MMALIHSFQILTKWLFQFWTKWFLEEMAENPISYQQLLLSTNNANLLLSYYSTHTKHYKQILRIAL